MRRIFVRFGSVVVAIVMLSGRAAVERRTPSNEARGGLAGQGSSAAGSRPVDVASPPEAVALEQALSRLRSLGQQGGWPRISAKALLPGRSHPAVAALRHRLVASGELPESANGGVTDRSRYDEKV